jgi:hypothetical protein
MATEPWFFIRAVIVFIGTHELPPTAGLVCLQKNPDSGGSLKLSHTIYSSIEDDSPKEFSLPRFLQRFSLQVILQAACPIHRYTSGLHLR